MKNCVQVLATIILSLSIFVNCSTKNKSNEKLEETKQEKVVETKPTHKNYYLFRKMYDGFVDTIPVESAANFIENTLLEGVFYFRYSGENDMHIISKYVYASKTDSTEGNISYTLDTLGVIYNKSTYYPSFAVLSSTNDSLNEFLNTALNFALLDQFQKPNK
jgi:hypothetical protein